MPGVAAGRKAPDSDSGAAWALGPKTLSVWGLESLTLHDREWSSFGAQTGLYRDRRLPHLPKVQSREATGCGREKGGWLAVNGTKREGKGVFYMTLKELCARDCLCSSTQLQMSLGFPPSLPLFSLLPSLWLTLSHSHSYFHPFLSFSLFFLFQLNEKECVWQGLATNSTWPHMRFDKNRNRVWLDKMMEHLGRDTCSNQRKLTDEADELDKETEGNTFMNWCIATYKPAGFS